MSDPSQDTELHESCCDELSPRVRWNADTLFPKKRGWGARKDIHRRLRLLQRVQGRLEVMLHPLEEVLYVAHGVHDEVRMLSCLLFFLNHVVTLFQMIAARHANRILFVFTNLRVIMINSDRRGRPRRNCWQVYYTQIVNFRSEMRAMRIELRDRTRLLFSGLPSKDRKALANLFRHYASIQDFHAFDPAVSQSRETLCCFCFQVVPRGVYTCPTCAARFIPPKDAALRSLMLPCLGDFLLGHKVLGTMGLILYVATWVFFLNRMIQNPGAAAALLPLFAFFVAAEHALSCLMTYSIGRQALVPRQAE